MKLKLLLSGLHLATSHHVHVLRLLVRLRSALLIVPIVRGVPVKLTNWLSHVVGKKWTLLVFAILTVYSTSIFYPIFNYKLDMHETL